jgi:hypothetical protein
MSQDPIDAERLLQQDNFGDVDVPPELQESLQRHRDNLIRLITSLRSAGISDEQIETSVNVIVSSYKEELLLAIKTMVR